VIERNETKAVKIDKNNLTEDQQKELQYMEPKARF